MFESQREFFMKLIKIKLKPNLQNDWTTICLSFLKFSSLWTCLPLEPLWNRNKSLCDKQNPPQPSTLNNFYMSALTRKHSYGYRFDETRFFMFHYFLICILYLLNWTLKWECHSYTRFFTLSCMSASTSFTSSIVLVFKRKKSFFSLLPIWWDENEKRKFFSNNFTSFSDYCCKEKSGRIILW